VSSDRGEALLVRDLLIDAAELPHPRAATCSPSRRPARTPRDGLHYNAVPRPASSSWQTGTAREVPRRYTTSDRPASDCVPDAMDESFLNAVPGVSTHRDRRGSAVASIRSCAAAPPRAPLATSSLGEHVVRRAQRCRSCYPPCRDSRPGAERSPLVAGCPAPPRWRPILFTDALFPSDFPPPVVLQKVQAAARRGSAPRSSSRTARLASPGIPRGGPRGSLARQPAASARPAVEGPPAGRRVAPGPASLGASERCGATRTLPRGPCPQASRSAFSLVLIAIAIALPIMGADVYAGARQP